MSFRIALGALALSSVLSLSVPVLAQSPTPVPQDPATQATNVRTLR